MPAIGASTTGTGTVSGPRDRGMPRLSGVGPGAAKPCGTSPPPAEGPLRPVTRRRSPAPGARRPVGGSALLPRLRDLAGPGDGVEVLGGAEADRDQLPVVGREVDQADR